MFSQVINALNTTLKDWDMMQRTAGDEGAEWAERFERHFYEFIVQFEEWFHLLEMKPTSIEEAEQLQEVEVIQNRLPAPLQLNFTMELERIIDGLETTRYD